MFEVFDDIAIEAEEIRARLALERRATRRYDRFRARRPWRWFPERAWAARILAMLWRADDRLRYEWARRVSHHA